MCSRLIGVLSGGERNRYALARMLLHPSNFLLLDEPTNHLDMRAKDVLLEALEKFNGTVVFVSHDRYFIDKLATRVFEIGDGAVDVFPGNYEDYLWRKQRDGDQEVVTSERRKAQRTLPEFPLAAMPQIDDTKPKRINPIKLKQMELSVVLLSNRRSPSLNPESRNARPLCQSFVSSEETQRQTALLEQRRRQLDEASLSGKRSHSWSNQMPKACSFVAVVLSGAPRLA